MKMEKLLTLHILDSITSFLPPSDTLHMPVDQCFWEEGSVRILLAKFLFLGQLQKVHIPDPLHSPLIGHLVCQNYITWNFGMESGIRL